MVTMRMMIRNDDDRDDYDDKDVDCDDNYHRGILCSYLCCLAPQLSCT